MDPAVVIIRHAEKPEPDGDRGVDHQGAPSTHGLTPRGWSRAGALGFRLSQPSPDLPTPLQRVFAVKATSSNRTHRCLDTAIPIAARLNCHVVNHFARGEEAVVAQQVLATDSPALIVWDHERIPELLRSFTLQAGQTVPDTWPEGRFDLFAVLLPTATGYQLLWQPQDLLAGDLPVLTGVNGH